MGRRGIAHPQQGGGQCRSTDVDPRCLAGAAERWGGRPIDSSWALTRGRAQASQAGLVIVIEWRRLQAPSRSDRARPAGEAQKAAEGEVSIPSVHSPQHSAPKLALLQLAGSRRLRFLQSSDFLGEAQAVVVDQAGGKLPGRFDFRGLIIDQEGEVFVYWSSSGKKGVFRRVWARKTQLPAQSLRGQVPRRPIRV